MGVATRAWWRAAGRTHGDWPTTPVSRPCLEHFRASRRRTRTPPFAFALQSLSTVRSQSAPQSSASHLHRPRPRPQRPPQAKPSVHQTARVLHESCTTTRLAHPRLRRDELESLPDRRTCQSARAPVRLTAPRHLPTLASPRSTHPPIHP